MIGERLREALDPLFALVRLIPTLRETRSDPALREIQRAYLGWMPLCLLSEPLLWLRRLFGAPFRFENPLQKPRSFYAPQLRAEPSPLPDEVSARLAAAGPAIRAEYERVASLEIDSPSVALLDGGSWKTIPLMRAAKPVAENIERCPETWAVVQQCPLPDGVRGGVYFSILSPGTRIQPHCGPSNLKWRYHLTIEAAEGARIRSGEVWRSWRPDDCMILDDSLEHEVVHDGTQERVVLIVDCWHPDLTAAERAFLQRVHRIWRGRR